MSFLLNVFITNVILVSVFRTNVILKVFFKRNSFRKNVIQNKWPLEQMSFETNVMLTKSLKKNLFKNKLVKTKSHLKPKLFIQKTCFMSLLLGVSACSRNGQYQRKLNGIQLTDERSLLISKVEVLQLLRPEPLLQSIKTQVWQVAEAETFFFSH